MKLELHFGKNNLVSNCKAAPGRGTTNRQANTAYRKDKGNGENRGRREETIEHILCVRHPFKCFHIFELEVAKSTERKKNIRKILPTISRQMSKLSSMSNQ